MQSSITNVQHTNKLNIIIIVQNIAEEIKILFPHRLTRSPFPWPRIVFTIYKR